ncbi:unnamed protein product [Cuscuta epithymum]|uniref:Uncharacterized protein n=1 Tax=Cuscuta epithymum TaxID=186058 RepID=A0AAV0G4R6_9ASTE|nr:unnamed protein product [Cuscuta epithymum]CAH9142564.1 unnamed protein product [Cuscuta epithymum]
MDSKSGSGGVIVTRERESIENPFALKVGQVFTGFGIGCGVGIGVGRPINLAAIPMLDQVMVATRGATDAFSSVGRNVNKNLRRLGAKNIEAGIGCGIGLGHGLGIGIAVKPGVVHKIQSCLNQLAAKAMMKFGMSFDLPSVTQGVIPKSIQSSNPLGDLMASKPKAIENIKPKDGNRGSFAGSSGKNPLNNGASHSSQTDTLINNFLKNPLLKDGDNGESELAERLRSENNLLHLVLKHQRVIDELMQQNEKLREILVDDLKVPLSKLQGTISSGSKSPCIDCRRKQRRRR